MSRFWWVNHKQTVRQEIDGQYLWSPKVEAGGARSQFYDNMRQVEPGDIVLSYANQVVGYVGRVADFAFTAPKPSEYGTAGGYWSQIGWRLPVFWTPISPPVSPKLIIDEIGPLLPTRYSPIHQLTGRGNQKAYLAEISQAVATRILSGTLYDQMALATGGANSLLFEAERQVLDDVIEETIERDPNLSATTRLALVQSRRGQGIFRQRVSSVEPKCRLTGISNPLLLIASHIKPWRLCQSAEERLDGMNGLMLTPDADRLFDRGFVSFDDDGQPLVSTRADADDLRRLGLESVLTRPASSNWDLGPFRPEQSAYLAFHRREVFLTPP